MEAVVAASMLSATLCVVRACHPIPTVVRWLILSGRKGRQSVPVRFVPSPRHTTEPAMPGRFVGLAMRVPTFVVCCAAWLTAAGWAQGQSPAGPTENVLSEGFEGKIPDFHTYQATYAADAARAHGGTHSLRVTPAGRSGGAYFRLDGVVDRKSDYEFSAWVYAGAPDAARLYISAGDGKQRHTKALVSGSRAGQWVHLMGTLRGKEWRPTDREVMMAMSCTTESWFDDVVLRKTTLPDPPPPASIRSAWASS